jgi:hypothetical protein
MLVAALQIGSGCGTPSEGHQAPAWRPCRKDALMTKVAGAQNEGDGKAQALTP